MKKIIDRLKQDFSTLQTDIINIYHQLKNLISFLLTNKEDIPLKFKAFQSRTIRFKANPLHQKLICIGVICSIIMLTSLATRNMVYKIMQPSKQKIIIADNIDNKPIEKVTTNKLPAKQETINYVDQQDTPKVENIISTIAEKKHTQEPIELLEGQFKIIDHKVKFHTVSLSPYPVHIEEATLQVLNLKKIRLKLKLTNESSETITGGISAYLSYVDQGDVWHQKFSHNNSKKIGDYLTGDSTKYKFRHSSKKYLNFDFSEINIKAVNTVHIYLRDAACLTGDLNMEKCSFETAKKKYSSYIEPNIEFKEDVANYAIYKKN